MASGGERTAPVIDFTILALTAQFEFLRMAQARIASL